MSINKSQVSPTTRLATTIESIVLTLTYADQHSWTSRLSINTHGSFLWVKSQGYFFEDDKVLFLLLSNKTKLPLWRRSPLLSFHLVFQVWWPIFLAIPDTDFQSHFLKYTSCLSHSFVSHTINVICFFLLLRISLMVSQYSLLCHWYVTQVKLFLLLHVFANSG